MHDDNDEAAWTMESSDTRVVEFQKVQEGYLMVTPSRKSKRKPRSESQPKCSLKVCRKLCPYRDAPFRSDVVRMKNGNDAVIFGRERKKSNWVGCVVTYLNRKCRKDEPGDEWRFMRSHVARTMESCPLKMEQEISSWSKNGGNR